MTEISRPWDGRTTGDAGVYTAEDWSEMWFSFFQTDATVQGVLYNPSTDNLVVINPASTTMRIGSGYALVDGTWYSNSVDRDLQSMSGAPSVNPRIDVVVLEKDTVAQTVRATIVEGAEAASPSAPTLTQVDGHIWQIPLAQYQISTGSVISNLIDRRAICRMPIGMLFLIEEIDLVAVGGATHIISSIPEMFSALVFNLVADPIYSGGPGERDIRLRMNGDTTNQYAYISSYDTSAGTSTNGLWAASSILLSDVYMPTSSSGYGYVLSGEIASYGSRQGTIRPKLNALWTQYGTGGTLRNGSVGGYYKNNGTPITSLTFYTDGTNFGSVAGSAYLRLYGRV